MFKRLDAAQTVFRLMDVPGVHSCLVTRQKGWVLCSRAALLRVRRVLGGELEEEKRLRNGLYFVRCRW